MKFIELPAPFTGQRMWGAKRGEFQFMIVLDGDEYTVSARKPGGNTLYDGMHRRISDAASYGSRFDAEKACDRIYQRWTA